MELRGTGPNARLSVLCSRASPATSRVPASVRPDAGTLEVAGDAREHSTDSRAFGPVPRGSIVGRAVYRYAPAGRSGRGPWPEEYHRA